jgi:hypothetical protein
VLSGAGRVDTAIARIFNGDSRGSLPLVAVWETAIMRIEPRPYPRTSAVIRAIAVFNLTA